MRNGGRGVVGISRRTCSECVRTRWKARDQSTTFKLRSVSFFPLPLPSAAFCRASWVSLSTIFAPSVMIFPNHTLPHSESIVWTSVNQISALSESLSLFSFPPPLRPASSLVSSRERMTPKLSRRVAYGECRRVFCSLMKISDGRTRMLPAHTKVPHRTARDGSGGLLKRIACLILLPSQKPHRTFADGSFSRWVYRVRGLNLLLTIYFSRLYFL